MPIFFPFQIVVMDASDKDSLTQACSAMKVHLEDPRIAPLPCIILLNKKNKTLTDAEVSYVGSTRPLLVAMFV